ncbi:MAG TPA: hypothetical protein VMB47_01255 [Candidatus Aquilonibacter sp.]|nr:hypothetical protein [Candidatus Aquilonibacter sp.]
MRRSRQFLSVAAFVVLSTSCFGQTPQKIIQDYVRAEGGARALAKVQSLTISGSLRDESTDATGSYSLITKAPNKLYSELVIEPDRSIVAYNGRSAWGEQPGSSPHTLTGAEAAEWEAVSRYLNGHLLDAKKDKLGEKFVGTQNIGGRETYQLEFSLAPGVTREVFFDAQTHLIVREIVPQPVSKDSSAPQPGSQPPPPQSTQPAGMLEQIDYFDYKPVSGILEPSRIELRRDGRDYQITVTSVEVNAPVQDSVFDFPQAEGRPLPDIAQLLRDVAKNQQGIDEIVKQYTCHLTEIDEQRSSDGRLTPRSVKEYDVFYVGANGQAVRHLIAQGGKPLEGEEKKKADDRFNKEFDEKKKQATELESDPKKEAKQDEQDQAEISDFLRAEKFTNPRRELFRGQEVIVFDFGPNPDYKPKKLVDSIVQKLVGVIWIDEQARDVVRLEARFNNNAKIGGGLLASISKGSNFVFEQALINNEVWLPSYVEVHASARIVFLKGQQDEIDRFSDYKKFSTESKLDNSTPVDSQPNQ